MSADRLGSMPGGAKLDPYGQEISATGNDNMKFATYLRDGESGIDYAMNRYYAAGTARFLTADPMISSNALVLPGNWNRYTYVGDGPINKTDPLGFCSPDDDPPCYSATGTGKAPTDLGKDKQGDLGAAALLDELLCTDFPYCSSDQSLEDSQKKFFAPPPLPYKPLSKDSEQTMLKKAVDLANKALSNKNCAGLFNQNGKGPAPAALLASLIDGGIYGSISYGRISAVATSATTALKPGTIGVTITINDNANGLWGFEGPLGNAGTLLHELGHAYVDLWGADASAIQPDANSVTKSIANDETIYADCLKGLQQ